jgi:hypothetical protein
VTTYANDYEAVEIAQLLLTACPFGIWYCADNIQEDDVSIIYFDIDYWICIWS